MTGIQPQLLNIALNPSDVVYTPDWVARDMVEYFKPHGRILEPCAGDGVFLKYLPENTEWCEIEKGRDFFQWHEPVDWIVGNPPYEGFTKFFYHSLVVARQIIYLIPTNKIYNTESKLRAITKWGGVKELRVYGSGKKLGWDFNYLIGAYHFKRNYHGGMTMSYYE